MRESSQDRYRLAEWRWHPRVQEVFSHGLMDELHSVVDMGVMSKFLSEIGTRGTSHKHFRFRYLSRGANQVVPAQNDLRPILIELHSGIRNLRDLRKSSRGIKNEVFHVVHAYFVLLPILNHVR